MKAFSIALATTALFASSHAAPQVQPEDRVTLTILRECAKIADITARASCYDRNIGVEVAQPANTPPTGFGANQLPRPAAEHAARREQLTVTLAAATQRAPGIWLMTLDDGTQWEFVDAVPLSYDPPRKGQVAQISAASMGSYIFRLQGQQGVRTRRVK